MKIPAGILKCVVFLGHAELGEPDTFVAKATGFFAKYDGVTYLVTAQHVATEFSGGPFDMRMHLKDGEAATVSFDPEIDPMDVWITHPDRDVDLAAIVFPYGLQEGRLDHMAIDQKLLATDEHIAALDVGVGDSCYAIGLFRLMQGRKRNFPIVHTGSIAAMPSDELIPVEDWERKGERRYVRGYLVEMSNLRGLSGCPVLVRSTISAVVRRLNITETNGELDLSPGKNAAVSAPNNDLDLLGVWTGSWDAKPDDVLALDRGQEVRVPVGLGTVVPTSRLLEMLELPHVVAQRRELFEKYGQGERAEDAKRLSKSAN